MTFALDLAFGVANEGIVAAMLSTRFGYVEVPVETRAYDLRFLRPGKTDATVEVKTDRRARETGNVFIETSCSGKPSGITASPATHWVVDTCGEGVYLLPTAALRRLVEGSTRSVTGGDGGRARGILVAICGLRAVSSRID